MEDAPWARAAQFVALNDGAAACVAFDERRRSSVLRLDPEAAE